MNLSENEIIDIRRSRAEIQELQRLVRDLQRQGLWTAYTPVVTASTGTITAYTTTAELRVVGKSCLVAVKITLTNVGTASGTLRASVPFANAGAIFHTGHGTINGLATGLTVWIPPTWTDINVLRGDGASIFVNNYDIYIGIEFPVAQGG